MLNFSQRISRATYCQLFVACIMFGVLTPSANAQQSRQQNRRLQNPTLFTTVPPNILLRIVRAEDERRWDGDVRDLLSARSSLVRERAALAAGRIGNEAAVSELIRLLEHDDESDVRAMAAFALGEIESPAGADALLLALRGHPAAILHGRTLEALGKIAAALPKEQDARREELAKTIVDDLRRQHIRRPAPQTSTLLLGLTAALRARSSTGGPVIKDFLFYRDARVRADAANTLARLRLKDANPELRRLLTTDTDPIVRANAARVLGATEEKSAYEDLLDRALVDRDSRVRVSAIRALASLKDARATDALINRGNKLISSTQPQSGAAVPSGFPSELNELLEIATTLGRIRQGSNDERAVKWLRQLRPLTGGTAPEVEIALARVHPQAYLSQVGSDAGAKRAAQETLFLNWRAASSLAQGYGEIGNLPDTTSENKRVRNHAEEILAAMLDYKNSGINIQTLVAVHSEYAIPDVLRAYATFKPGDLAEVLRQHLKESDVIVRATAAELLGGLPAGDNNRRALIDALPVALRDKDNDASLAILDALGKQKHNAATAAIKSALDSTDHLVRRRAVAVLKANGDGDFSSRIGTVQTQSNYQTALGRVGKRVTAVVSTSKGSFTIELLPDEAPLNVDNFIRLAQRKYFRNIVVHRVVPNFVIQDGDPRGDGNGGPGYQIRCEINEVPYGRGMVGMALSGKDTGGSQWFITHSPQPHLDGGYTVFGRVIGGMNVVDNIARGDVIRDVVINERSGRSRR